MNQLFYNFIILNILLKIFIFKSYAKEVDNMIQNKWEENKKNIENIIENYNGYIQIVFLILTLFLGIIINKLDIQDEQIIILELTVLLSIEIIILNIKDSISQDKLNRILSHNDKSHNMVLIDIDEGYTQFPFLLQQANSDLFISGMTCNGIWNYTSTIEELLRSGSHIRILISSEKAIEDNVRIYYQLDSEPEISDYIDDAHSKINITLKALRNNKLIKNSYDKTFEVRRTNIPFTTAYVGINIYGSNGINKQLKVTQYVSGNETEKCPNMLLDSNENNFLYEYYIKTLKKIWDTAEPIDISI